ncbi:hypothetical protein E1161_11830 [Saccharopolyspora aridisoli]|uniref:LPXTG cell wall anchor domain-containing protein n=1 Tax=Saccharopolyspora aridisoli TaxID=2530385 RepID=A0A4R4UR47_9PSEU|nr:hypothetical protein [Saccharopolyspora aridisoli]TDC92786.1 hypothetical protein E1161_11830 [Saccharopolyspora aridisoli]
MWRIGRLLAGLAIALTLLLTPWAAASPASGQVEVAQVAAVAHAEAVAQQPTQESPAPERETQAERNQRTAMGVAGVVLIGLVLLSRKARKKSLLFFEKKK